MEVAYPSPGAVEIGLIEASDYLFDEVASGTEMAALPEQKRGLGVAEVRSGVDDGFEVAVEPVVSRHFSRERMWKLFIARKSMQNSREREIYGGRPLFLVLLFYIMRMRRERERERCVFNRTNSEAQNFDIKGMNNPISVNLSTVSFF